MMNENGEVIHVARIIDDGPVRGFQIAVILLCSLVAFFDGVDTQSIGIVGPIIAENLELARTALGPVFSSALLGAAVGALIFGPLGDKFGRKRMLALTALIFGIFTVATPLTHSYDTLLLVRFCAGIGLGGATPCFIALASEYAPARRRAMVASLIWAAFPLGGTIGGFVNSVILTRFGWQAVFLIGGVLPIAVAGALLVWLPESLRYLIANSSDPSAVRAIVRRIRPDIPPTARFVSDEDKTAGVPIRELFAAGRSVRTVLLWVPFFTTFATLGLMVLWTPLMLRDNGIAPAQAAIAIGVNGLGALIGMASAGRLMERFGASALLVPALLLGAVATATLGFAATALTSVLVALFIGGLFVGLGASGSIALATLIYPTAMRSTGVGWAMSTGRFGQVLAPLFASAMVGIGWSNTRLFLAIGVAPLLAALAVAILRPSRETAALTIAPATVVKPAA